MPATAIIGLGRTTMQMPDQLGDWTEDQMFRYDQARETIRSVIGAYSARLADAAPADVETLEAEQARHAQLLRTLDPGDTAAVERVLNEYPALLARLTGR
jgi:hypothetical protein